LKEYEHNILQLKYDHILDFLLNDILNSGFFHNTNFNRYLDLSKEIHIPKGLIKNLESEYILDSKNKLDD